MNVSVQGVDDVKAMLADLATAFPRAAKEARNNVIQVVWEGEKAQAVADLDQPRSFTISSILFNKDDTKGPARVWVQDLFNKEGADESFYLGRNLLSGTRTRLKGSEIALQSARPQLMPTGTVWVPASNVVLDAQGNIGGNVIKKMVDQLKAGDFSNYFVMGKPPNQKGIFARVGGEWYPFLWFVSPRQYAERWDFYGRADREVAYHFESIYGTAIQRELDRWRR
jgi:hypothetical protein